MRQFVKRAIQKIDDLDQKKSLDFIMTASREIDRLETVLDSLPKGILVCDTAHNLILANKSARRFLSIVSYEQGREPVWSVIPDELIAEFLVHTLMSAHNAEEHEFGIEVMGIERLLSVSVMPLVQNRMVSGSLILVDDITERRNREAMIRRMENLASLTTLAAGVAHEIKNPLGSISIHVQLIQKAMVSQEKACRDQRGSGAECEPFDYFRHIDKYLDVVNEEVERLNAIVVDFLFAVRPMDAKLKRGSINAFIKEMADFVSFELKTANIICTLDLAENLSDLDFDEGLMKQALLNLIKNAAAAIGEGGRGGGEIVIATEEKDGQARIIVSDTGAGISGENLKKIFEPYFTTKDNGTGLGLTLVFKIVKEHKGDISVKTVKGKGSVFIISLPVPQTNTRLITYNEPMESE